MKLSRLDKRIHLVAAIVAIALVLAACGGGGDSYTTVEGDMPATVIVEHKPLPLERSPTSPPAESEEPVDTTPPVALPEPECRKPDPQPTHGRDPACHRRG